jgi:Mce-associated membrane protein
MLVRIKDVAEERDVDDKDSVGDDTAQPVETAADSRDGALSADGDVAAEREDDDIDIRATQPEAGARRRVSLGRALAFGVIPGLVLVVAMAAAFLKWQDASMRAAETARVESMQAAKDSTIALLSYRPDTVEKDLGAASDRLTGNFRDSYTKLTHDVVIPGAKQRKISTVVDVPAVASISANANHAVVLVFVNQTTIIGADAPTATASSVRVTLDKIGARWLISDFTPV